MKSNSKKWLAALGALAVLVSMSLVAGQAAWAQSITPVLVEEEIADGDSAVIEKTVTTPTIPPLAEICFLADTTGSMAPALANVQAGIGTIMTDVLAESPSARFCAAQYKDVGSPIVFNLDQALTANTAAIQAAVNTWAAGGGGDTPEDQLHALTELSGPAPGWSPTPPSTHIIVWFGDASAKDPASGGETLASTINALTTSGAAAPVIVIAIDVLSGAADGLDAFGQATAITGSTGGVLLTGVDPNAVSEAISEALRALEIEIVVAMVSNCSSETGGVVTTTFAPPSQIVNAGDAAIFDETISVTAGPAEQGQTYECDDWATIDGEPMVDADGDLVTEHKVITVPDTTAPVARCIETTNPSGNNTPRSGPNAGNSGQNPDGFYELLASDNVDDDVEIVAVDKGADGIFGTADDFTFPGPFSNGTKVKYTEANGATPTQSDGPGAIDYQLKGRGDLAIYAVDAAGNVGTHVQCHVAPPPKRP